MNGKKLSGIILAVVVVGLIGYVMYSGSPKHEQTPKQETVTKQDINKMQEKSEEQKKLDELKEKVNDTKTTVTTKLYAQRCAACHGYSGEGIVGPVIKGKDEAYIMAKLDGYRSGKVRNSLMQGLLKNSSDEELKALAKEISAFK